MNTHYLRQRRSARWRRNAIDFAWFVTRLSIYASSLFLIGCTIYVGWMVL